MKKTILTISTAVLAISFVPNEVKGAEIYKTELTNDTAQMQLTILNRLNEIKGMDMSKLDRSEKRALKKEVRESERQLRGINGGGVYISVGALIIIVLLLIIIF